MFNYLGVLLRTVIMTVHLLPDVCIYAQCRTCVEQYLCENPQDGVMYLARRWQQECCKSHRHTCDEHGDGCKFPHGHRAQARTKPVAFWNFTPSVKLTLMFPVAVSRVNSGRKRT